MSRFQDLTGQKFDRLTVIKRIDDYVSPSGHKYVNWLCKCDCGNELSVISSNLKRGNTKSCGCLNREMLSTNKFIDLSGKRFGYLTVIKQDGYYIDPRNSKHPKWLCQCDCGNTTTVVCSALTTGHTNSCGCLSKETTRQCRKKYNDYDLSGDYGIGYTLKGEEFYFDLEDYDKIKDYCWRLNKENYVITQIIIDSKPQNIMMHRIIMLNSGELLNSKIDIDHINHNEYDNRKINLRIATRSQNNQNKMIASNNTSGFIGVYYYKNISKWGVTLTLNNKVNNLGYYQKFTEAVKSRIEGEQKYFGEYAYKPHKKVLDYINNGGELEPYNREMIENIMNQQ